MNIQRCRGFICPRWAARRKPRSAASCSGLISRCGAAHARRRSTFKINMPGASSVEFGVRWWGRIRALWPVKLRLTVILNVVFWACYLFLSRHALLPMHRLPMTWLDRWAGYQPHPWAWVYESIFLLTGITPWLIVSGEELRRYVLGF